MGTNSPLSQTISVAEEAGIDGTFEKKAENGGRRCREDCTRENEEWEERRTLRGGWVVEFIALDPAGRSCLTAPLAGRVRAGRPGARPASGAVKQSFRLLSSLLKVHIATNLPILPAS